MAAAEVVRGEFVYHDMLFVDVDGNRHPRASKHQLEELLLPTSKPNVKTPPKKDQVRHWYEAQLIHYGLPRTKDKNGAKVRLTTALSNQSLAVPEYLRQMEDSMKKEYNLKVRKAKRNAVAVDPLKKQDDCQGSKAPRTSKGIKRKAAVLDAGLPVNTAPQTSFSAIFGDISLEIKHNSQDDAKQTRPPAKKANALQSNAKKPPPRVSQGRTNQSPPQQTRKTPTTQRKTPTPRARPQSSSAKSTCAFWNRSPRPYGSKQSGEEHQTTNLYADTIYENDSPPPAYEDLNYAF